jgi:hypothetical protein
MCACITPYVCMCVCCVLRMLVRACECVCGDRGASVPALAWGCLYVTRSMQGAWVAPIAPSHFWLADFLDQVVVL